MADENKNEEFEKTLKMNDAIALRYAALAEAIADRAGGREGAYFMLRTARETLNRVPPDGIPDTGGAPEAFASARGSVETLIEKAGWRGTPLNQTADHCARLASNLVFVSADNLPCGWRARTRAGTLLALQMARQVLSRTRLDIADAWAPGELQNAHNRLWKLAALVRQAGGRPAAEEDAFQRRSGAEQAGSGAEQA